VPTTVSDSPERWPVESSRDLYRGDWIVALRADVVRRPGAADERAFERWVLEHPGAVVVLAVDDQERVCCLRQYRHAAQGRFVELPAGLRDADGEDPVETARRELREEAELEADDWRPLFDLYPSAGNTGDLDKARDELNQCGQPNGFTTGISYRAERPKEKATAEALQQSLARVGINLEIKPYPLTDYLKLYAGKPDFAKANNLGLMVYGWGADWPDGFGFLSQIVDSRAIRATGGNSNLSVRDPEVDKLIDQAVTTTDTAAREKVWVDVDKKVMDDAYIMPGIWAKGLLYRPPNLTNVFITNGFQMYDYLAMGTTRK